MKITRIRIVNYRGISELEQDIPPAGVVIKGPNKKGKTSFLKAFRAVMAAQDIGPDAIKNGADESEILVNLDRLVASRTITRSKSTLTVSKDLGNGVLSKVNSPVAYLQELLGSCAIDPLDIFLLKAKERRVKILEALPVTVTLEQLRQYVPDLPDDFEIEGHGLEVLERVRKAYYDARTAANGEARKAIGEAAVAAAACVQACAPLYDEAGERKFGDITVEAADAARVEAAQNAARIVSLAEQAQAAEERMASARARVVDVRGQRDEELRKAEEKIPSIAEHEEASRGVFALQQKIAIMVEDLEKARSELGKAQLLKAECESDMLEIEEHRRRAQDLDLQAEHLQATIDDASIVPPSPEGLAAARQAITKTEQDGVNARLLAAAGEARRKSTELDEIAQKKQARADELDAVVVRLQNEAPKELLAASNGIPGLTLDGDKVFLDGVSLDGLSGLEQLEFAVEVARRANAKSKILVCDGTERVDPEQFAAFVKLATKDGYQLIASRVDKGQLVLEAIES